MANGGDVLTVETCQRSIWGGAADGGDVPNVADGGDVQRGFRASSEPLKMITTWGGIMPAGLSGSCVMANGGSVLTVETC